MNKEDIIKDNDKLIWKICNKFYGIDKNDLYQAGVVGLLKALENYKKDACTKFSTYAYPYIFGEMYNLACNKSIKISKDILLLYKKIEKSRYIIAQKLHKIPNNIELSEYLNIPLEDIEFALMSASIIMSLDDEKDDVPLYEKISDKSNSLENHIIIEDGMNCLNNVEKDIIKSRYYEDMTQSEIAKKLKLTQVMVSRYEKKGIQKMRNYLTM